MLFENTIVGPIHSRRLGTSLGINLLPQQRKVCSYDCIYCECGWNKESEAKEIQFPEFQKIAEQLEMRLQELVKQGVRVDSFTFSGNGEPTMSPNFSQAVDLAIAMRDKYYPQAVVSLLSNATQLYKSEVFNAVQKLDNLILKLDAGTAKMQTNINKPNANCCTFAEITENLVKIGNKCIIQTLLLRGLNDEKIISNVSESEFKEYLQIVEKIRPKYVMLYAIDRATPEKRLEKLTIDELKKYAQILENEGIRAKVFG